MYHFFISFILFLNVTLLAILVPGGPIENRDFSHLKGFIFWGFNLFLIGLGMSTFYTSFAVLQELNSSRLLVQLVSIGFIVVYALDLAGIFPKSPSKMSKSLMLFEIINLCSAVYLYILSFAF